MDRPPPRVILNDRALRNPRTGVGHYITELTTALRRQYPDLALLPFYQTWCVRQPRAAESSAPRTPGRWQPWARRAAQEVYALAFELAGTLGGYELYHEPNHIPTPWHGPVITTIHDLSVLRHPEWHPADRVDWYERNFTAALPRSEHFIAVSEFTKREMIELLGLAAERITVIPNGVRAIFHPRPSEAVNKWLQVAGLPGEFLLYLGTIEPRKNLPGTIAAYAMLPAEIRRGRPLLIAGMAGWGRDSVQALASRNGVEGSVRVLGYVSDEDLAWLYCGAGLLIWPSFYEGFGLPPLEAMASGTPVVSSDCSSLPQVVGEAGLLVDPQDVDGLSRAMRTILTDPLLASGLRERGLARSRSFSWEASAAGHMELYRRFASGGSGEGEKVGK